MQKQRRKKSNVSEKRMGGKKEMFFLPPFSLNGFREWSKRLVSSNTEQSIAQYRAESGSSKGENLF